MSEFASNPVEPTVRTKAREQTRTRRVPPYHVILKNDEDHSCEFVVNVLMKSLGAPGEKAMQLMWEAHSKGQAIVWTGPKEVAELKVEQIQTFHEHRNRDNADLGPLDCVIEPAP